MVAITALGERLEPTIRELVKRCPRLSTVIVSQMTELRFTMFVVPDRIHSETERRTITGIGEGKGTESVDGGEVVGKEDEDNVVIEWECHKSSQWWDLRIQAKISCRRLLAARSIAVIQVRVVAI